ncbi:MAG TPA: hypothetical protein VF659_01765 [Pyrinomonadaceae bacterium]|jgi:hypothetical protein
MANVEVSGDVRGLVTFDEQLTYAAAVALTRTAKDAQSGSIEAVRRTFTTRGTWYLPSGRFGIRITPATKARLEAAVRTAADWLIPHETGEDKVASGGGMLAIPLVGRGRPRPSQGAKVRSDLKPRALGRRGVVVETRRGPVLFGRQDRRLVAFYGLERRARIRKRSTVIEPTVQTFGRNFGDNLAEAITEALRTAK